ncbi:MAG: PDZ domain-containing protein, partial [Planctomycetia bacterium]|nr:PDZ domain-containing protein [Planctomycetia bacterium]
LLWQSPAFVGPFEFALDGIVGIRFPQPEKRRLPEAAGDWLIELVSGDQFAGGIESIDEQHVVATIGSAASPVRLVVRRDAVKSVFRSELGATFIGSDGLASWQQGKPGTWRQEDGRLISAAPGAKLFREFKAGARTRYDLSLSWRQRPTVQIALGMGGAQEVPGAYRLELGPGGMVAVREEKGSADGDSAADLEPCGDLPENGLTLTVFIDQDAGRLAVMLPDADKPIADLAIPSTGGKTGGGVQFTVVTGTAALDSLRVSPWRGGSLSLDDTRAGAIRLRDGESLAAVVVGVEKGSAVALVRAAADAAGGEPRRIPLDTIEEMLFPSAADVAGERKVAGRRGMQATDVYGSRLSGKLLRVEEGAVWLAHPAIEGPVSMPIATLATLVSFEQPAKEQQLPGRLGQLACQAGTLWGCLAKDDGATGGDPPAAVAIAWQPLGSLNASLFVMPEDGSQPQATITYVETRQKGTSSTARAIIGGIGGAIETVDNRPAVLGLIAGSPAERAGVKSGEIILAIAPRGDGRFVDTAKLSMEDTQHLLRGRVGSKLQLRLQMNGQEQPREVGLVRQSIPQPGGNPQLLQQALQAQDRLLPLEVVQVDQNAPDWFGSRLILRTGETLPCRVEAIDDAVVRVLLQGGEPATVAADQVQAVELVPAVTRPLTAEKIRSLTMLPRSQRQQPPTHVLRSVQGDYLRGRLVSMDTQTVRIAVEANPKGKPLSIPRSDVSRLIWLHPENLETPWTPPQPQGGQGLFVESVSGSNQRLRMMATGVEGNLLVGTSPVVGPCRIDLEKIERLMIGRAIDNTPRSPPYAQWKLQPAPEPRNLPPRGR